MKKADIIFFKLDKNHEIGHIYQKPSHKSMATKQEFSVIVGLVRRHC